MIEIVEGVGVGAGKSYYVAGRILSHIAVGGTVFASDTFGLDVPSAFKLIEERWGVLPEPEQFNVFPQADIPRLHEVTPIGTPDAPVLVVVDEAHAELNARDWSDHSKRPFFLWLTQSRHDDTDVIFISQAAANMDKQIARLATRIIRTRNLVGWSIPGIGKWPLKQFVHSVYDRDGRTMLSRKWVWHDKGIFRVYNSKVMRGSHKRREGIVPKKKLNKSTKRNPMILKFILVFVLCAVGWIAYTWQTNPVRNLVQGKTPIPSPKITATPPSPVPLSQSPSLVQAAQPRPKFRIITETFRGQIGDDYLSTSGGVYQRGVMCSHGYVVGIANGVVRIMDDQGETLFVVTGAASPIGSPSALAQAALPMPRPVPVVHDSPHLPQPAQVAQPPTPAPPQQVQRPTTPPASPGRWPEFRGLNAMRLRQ